MPALRAIAAATKKRGQAEGALPLSEDAALDYLRGSGSKEVLDHVDKLLSDAAAAGKADSDLTALRRQTRDLVDGALKQIVGGAPALESIAPRQRFGLEALIQLTGRPALPIVGGTVAENDPRLGEWAIDIVGQRNALKPLIDAVGRIDIQINGDWVHVGTGTVVAPGLVMTNRHVLDAIADERAGASGRKAFAFWAPISIAFDERPGSAANEGDPKRRFAVKSVVSAGALAIGDEADIAKLDMAFFEMATNNEAGGVAPSPVAVTGLPSAGKARLLVVGFPARPGSAQLTDPTSQAVSTTIIDRLWEIYGNNYGQKYASPGELGRRPGEMAGDAQKWGFSHDSTTLAGNSGSSVISLGNARVFGLHFGGAPLRLNMAHTLDAVRKAAAGFIDPAVFDRFSWP